MFLGVGNNGGYLGNSGSHIAVYVVLVNVRGRSGTMRRVDFVVVDGSGRRAVVEDEFICTGEGQNNGLSLVLLFGRLLLTE